MPADLTVIDDLYILWRTAFSFRVFFKKKNHLCCHFSFWSFLKKKKITFAAIFLSVIFNGVRLCGDVVISIWATSQGRQFLGAQLDFLRYRGMARCRLHAPGERKRRGSHNYRAEHHSGAGQRITAKDT